MHLALCISPALLSSPKLNNLHPLPPKVLGKRKRMADKVEGSGLELDIGKKAAVSSGQTLDEYKTVEWIKTVDLIESKPPGTLQPLNPNDIPAVQGEPANIYATLEASVTTIRISKEARPSINNLAGGEGFRRRHLAALAAVLHRNISEGDYLRAGRAWGILLRSESHGHPVDIRENDCWGLGAEVLYQRHLSYTKNESEGGEGLILQGSGEHLLVPNKSRILFNRKRFQEALNFYERLILQYPYRQISANTSIALDFHSALLGLLISSSSADSNITNGTFWDDESISSEKRDQAGVKSLQGLKVNNFQRASLKQAKEIVARLDELLISPPYSNTSELCILRDMLALWILDLSITASPQETRNSIREDNSYVSREGSSQSAEGALKGFANPKHNGSLQEYDLASKVSREALVRG